MRIAWRTVGAIITRVWADVEQLHDRFAGLRRIGIDEISYKRGHKYLTVVVDHDSGRLVWAAPGRDKATLDGFFDALEAREGAAPRSPMSALMARTGSRTVVADRCPNAVRCADPFHVVKWATEALDEVRRQAWNTARGASHARRPGAGRATGHGEGAEARPVRVVEEPREPDQPAAGQAGLDRQDRPPAAPGLPAQGRAPARLQPRPGRSTPTALDRWVGWARRCRIPAFVDLQRRIVKHQASILAAIEHGLSNGRIESVNTKIRLITRIAFGFSHPEALIALAMLSLGGHPPALPGRT